MKTVMKAFLTAALIMLAFQLGAKASDAPPSLTLKSKLTRQLYLINSVLPYVERIDLNRAIALKQFTQRVFDSMKKEGMTNMITMQRLQELVICFRFSKDLFRQIETPKTSKAIEELQKLGSEIASITGFDKSPYTQITLSVFTQIHELLGQLLSLPIPDALKLKIKALNPSLGSLIASASLGDHAETFAQAKAVLSQLIALNPDFNDISFSHEAFYPVLEIQGLAEFYSQFSRLSYEMGPTGVMSGETQ